MSPPHESAAHTQLTRLCLQGEDKQEPPPQISGEAEEVAPSAAAEAAAAPPPAVEALEDEAALQVRPASHTPSQTPLRSPQAASQEEAALLEAERAAASPLSPEEQARAVVSSVAQVVEAQPLLKGALWTGGLFLAATLAFSVYKVYLRFNSQRSKRKRQVGKNVVVVEALAKYLPAQRSLLTPGVVKSLCARTGFSADSVFRKQLRYMLNERPFDGEAAADVVALRAACGLSDEQVRGVLADTAERTFKSTGILMRRPKGLTAEGLARKVQGRALFSKLLYLVEMEGLVPASLQEATRAMLLDTFGATGEDADALRIPSLTELDEEALNRMWAAGGRDVLAELEEEQRPEPPHSPA